MFCDLNISVRCENNAALNMILSYPSHTVILRSVSICNDCFPVNGQISAAASHGFPQRGIHTGLQSGMLKHQCINVNIIFVTILLTVIDLCCCAGVAECRGCFAANSGGGLSAACC